jgi:septal ring factor EnvC (AmiA/AmiB activator)
VALYKYSRAGYMHILADAQDLDQFRQRVKYVWAVMREDRKVLATLMEEARQAHGEISRIRRKMTEAESRKDEENTRLAVLKKDLDEKVLLLMNVHREKEFYETAVRELELGAQDLKRTLSDIESKKSENIPKDFHFAHLEGKLPLPLDGKPVRGGQFLKTPDLNLRKGVFIEAASDREVKAVFPGRVDFSGRLKGYGEMIVINHGERFFTISALLSQRTKKKGDRVKAGEAIGRVAGEGPSKEAVVYFEIRRRGENLDPMKWFKLP